MNDSQLKAARFIVKYVRKERLNYLYNEIYVRRTAGIVMRLANRDAGTDIGTLLAQNIVTNHGIVIDLRDLPVTE